jgi:hypothetical protein
MAHSVRGFPGRQPSWNISGIITLTKQAQDIGIGRQADAMTTAMIDAGVEALQRRGYGLESNEPTDSLRLAVKAVFCAMAEASHRGQKIPGG